MGWTPGQGIGKQSQGIPEPILARWAKLIGRALGSQEKAEEGGNFLRRKM